MASDKQIAANRLNAKKSTGAKTAAGKEKVGRNAVKYGLYAKEHFLLPEREAGYARLIVDLVERKNPQGAEEEDIVEQIARNSALLAQCDLAHHALLLENARLCAAQRIYKFEEVSIVVASNLHMFESVKKQMLLESAKDIELVEEDYENALKIMFADPAGIRATALINRSRQSYHMNIKRLEERLCLLQKERRRMEEEKDHEQVEKEWQEGMSRTPPPLPRRPVSMSDDDFGARRK